MTATATAPATATFPLGTRVREVSGTRRGEVVGYGVLPGSIEVRVWPDGHKPKWTNPDHGPGTRNPGTWTLTFAALWERA